MKKCKDTNLEWLLQAGFIKQRGKNMWSRWIDDEQCEIAPQFKIEVVKNVYYEWHCRLYVIKQYCDVLLSIRGYSDDSRNSHGIPLDWKEPWDFPLGFAIEQTTAQEAVQLAVKRAACFLRGVSGNHGEYYGVYDLENEFCECEEENGK